MSDDVDRFALELVADLAALEACGLVAIEDNDLGEVRVSPTAAGILAVRDYEQEADMATSARACAVPNCPAMAVDESDVCAVHRVGRRFGLGRPSTPCRRCKRIVKPTDYITNRTFEDGSVEHVNCPPAREAAAEAS